MICLGAREEKHSAMEKNRPGQVEKKQKKRAVKTTRGKNGARY